MGVKPGKGDPGDKACPGANTRRAGLRAMASLRCAPLRPMPTVRRLRSRAARDCLAVGFRFGSAISSFRYRVPQNQVRNDTAVSPRETGAPAAADRFLRASFTCAPRTLPLPASHHAARAPALHVPNRSAMREAAPPVRKRHRERPFGDAFDPIQPFPRRESSRLTSLYGVDRMERHVIE
jgi:hypothetical protein